MILNEAQSTATSKRVYGWCCPAVPPEDFEGCRASGTPRSNLSLVSRTSVFVRSKNAVFAVYAIYREFENHILGAPELIQTFLAAGLIIVLMKFDELTCCDLRDKTESGRGRT